MIFTGLILGQEQESMWDWNCHLLKKSLMFFREKVQHEQRLQFLMFQST